MDYITNSSNSAVASQAPTSGATSQELDYGVYDPFSLSVLLHFKCLVYGTCTGASLAMFLGLVSYLHSVQIMPCEWRYVPPGITALVTIPAVL